MTSNERAAMGEHQRHADMIRPLVTIGIPTYNRADSYLREAIQAALGQTYDNLQVLVADNCSTDDTAALVRGIADPRLTYLRHERNIGARNNMNFLLAQATGEYFLLYPDDDQIDPDFIEVCMEAARGHPMPGLIMTGARVIDERGRMLRQTEGDPSATTLEDLILRWYERRIHMFLCGTLFNTRVLFAAGGFEEKYGNFDDVAAEFKCAAAQGHVIVPAVKAGLRAHSTSITRLAGVAAWIDSSLALLDLAMSVGSSRRAEIAAVGRRTSAARNYDLANELPALGSRWKANLTVLRRFGFRHWPDRHAVKHLVLTTLRASRRGTPPA